MNQEGNVPRKVKWERELEGLPMGRQWEMRIRVNPGAEENSLKRKLKTLEVEMNGMQWTGIRVE